MRDRCARPSSDPVDFADLRGYCPFPHKEATTGMTQRQLSLFSGHAELLERMERALAAADLPAARRARRELAAEWGEAAVPNDTSFLEDPALDDWTTPDRPCEALQAWLDVERLPAITPARARGLRRAYMQRLVEAFEPSVLARCEPRQACGDSAVERDAHPEKERKRLPVAGSPAEFLAHLEVVNALLRAGRSHEALRLVRDSLLEGGFPGLEEVAHPDIDDLAAEDLAPGWLACLGAIRRVWECESPAPEDLDLIAPELASPLPEDDVEQVRAFWRALGIAALGSRIPEKLLFAARTRLKRLHADLHAAYLHHSGPYA